MLAACSGNAVVEEDESGGSGAGGSGTGGATSTGSSTATGTGGTGIGGGGGNGGVGGAPDACDNVPEYINNLYVAAAGCSPADPGPHCTDIVDGICCPVVVESINSPATQAYLDFLNLAKQDCPQILDECALIDCAFPVGGQCVPDAAGMDGICQPVF